MKEKIYIYINLVDTAEAAFSDLARGMEAAGGRFQFVVREHAEIFLISFF
jgi:hypothetical protein